VPDHCCTVIEYEIHFAACNQAVRDVRIQELPFRKHNGERIRTGGAFLKIIIICKGRILADTGVFLAGYTSPVCLTSLTFAAQQTTVTVEAFIAIYLPAVPALPEPSVAYTEFQPAVRAETFRKITDTRVFPAVKAYLQVFTFTAIRTGSAKLTKLFVNLSAYFTLKTYTRVFPAFLTDLCSRVEPVRDLGYLVEPGWYPVDLAEPCRLGREPKKPVGE